MTIRASLIRISKLKKNYDKLLFHQLFSRELASNCEVLCLTTQSDWN